MAQHVRYADWEKNSRVTIKFERYDLLWSGEIAGIRVPIRDGDRLIGPTILDMMVRHETEDEHGKSVFFWKLRDDDDFLLPAAQRDDDALHPFKPGVVSGGAEVHPQGTFVKVRKMTNISLGVYAFRFAVGAYGNLNAAYDTIAARAAAAWSDDLIRSQALYEKISQAPNNILLETPSVTALRPAGSVSDAIETELMRDACTRLNIDPDLNVKRPRGGQRKPPGDPDAESGNFISITVKDGQITKAVTIAEIAGLPKQTDLIPLSTLVLISLLDVLERASEEIDKELLEAFLDNRDPNWRNQRASRDQENATTPDDPYKVLGVEKTASLSEVKARYRKLIKHIHSDTTIFPDWFAATVNVAYHQIEESMKEKQDE